MIKHLKNEESISINLFGKETSVEVQCTGDNLWDENGNYKNYGFELNDEELDLLNWFIENVKIENYKKEILNYCNEVYSCISDKKIELKIWKKKLIFGVLQ